MEEKLQIMYVMKNIETCSIRFGKWSRLEQRHGLQSTTLTSYFYKNIC
jgi:hypothetical protein